MACLVYSVKTTTAAEDIRSKSRRSVTEIYVQLCRFLPRLTRTAFEEELSSLDVTTGSLPHTTDGMERSTTCKTVLVSCSVFWSGGEFILEHCGICLLFAAFN